MDKYKFLPDIIILPFPHLPLITKIIIPPSNTKTYSFRKYSPQIYNYSLLPSNKLIPTSKNI